MKSIAEKTHPSVSQNNGYSSLPVQMRVVNLLIVAVMCFGGGYLIYANYNQKLEAANQQVIDASARYHDNAWLIMSAVDSALRSTLEWLHSNPNADNESLNNFLAETATSYTFVRTMIVVLPDGNIIGDSRPGAPAAGVNIADREYFRRYVDGQITGIDIDFPVTSRIDGAWSVPVARASYDEEGNLQWYVNAAFDPVYFAELFVTKELSHIDQGFIINDRGNILASIPFDGNLLNTPTQDFDFIRDQLSQSTSNYFQGDTLLEDGQSIIAYQRSQDYPFTVITQVQLTTVLQPVLRDGIITIIVVLVLSLITTTISHYQIKREQNIRQQIVRRRQSEHELQTLTNNINDIVVRFDRDLRHVYVNPALLHATGLTEKDYLGKTNRDLDIPDEQVSFWDREIRLVFESKQENIIEFEYETINGKRHFQGRLTPEFDEQGNVETVLNVVRDITALKQTQAQLEDQKRALQTQYLYQRTMTELGLLAIRTSDLQNFMDQFVAIIAEALDVEYTKILELTPDKTHLWLRSGVGWHEGIVGSAYVDTDQQSQAGYTLSISEPVVVNNLPDETRFQGPQLLTNHDVISGMSTLIHTPNEPYGILGIHSRHLRVFTEHDVEFLQGIAGLLSSVIQYKWAEQSAIQEHNLLRKVIDNVPDLIFVKDNDERFIETNLAHARTGGVSRDEMIGRTAGELFDIALAQQFHADDKLVLQTGQSIINEERVTTDGDGNQRWILTTKVPLQDDDGTIMGLIGISRDVTDRRSAEIERQETGRLQIEMEKERQLLELKERFIATASHNFRTPLAIISSGTSLLDRYLERFSPAEQREKLDKIQMQVDHMTRLLDDILTLHKLNTGKLNLAKIQFNLQELCQRIWEDMLALDADRHPKDFQYLAQQTMIVADESILQQIIHNLLSNAFKYTPNGKPITFQIKNDERWFILTVKDEGIGIPEAEQSQLFQPFHRASNASSFQGTGLGLAIIKEYVELHQGQVTVESEEKKGTTFTVFIPIIRDESKSHE